MFSFVRKGLGMLVSGSDRKGKNAQRGQAWQDNGQGGRRRPRSDSVKTNGAAASSGSVVVVGTKKCKRGPGRPRKQATAALSSSDRLPAPRAVPVDAGTLSRTTSNTSLTSDRSRGRHLGCSVEYLHADSQLQLVIPSSKIKPSLSRVLQGIEARDCNFSDVTEAVLQGRRASADQLCSPRHTEVEGSEPERQQTQEHYAEYDADSEDEAFLDVTKNHSTKKGKSKSPSTLAVPVGEFESMIDAVEKLCHRFYVEGKGQEKVDDVVLAAAVAKDDATAMAKDDAAATAKVTADRVRECLPKSCSIVSQPDEVDKLLRYWKAKHTMLGPLLRRFQKSPLLDNWTLPLTGIATTVHVKSVPRPRVRAGPKRTKTAEMRSRAVLVDDTQMTDNIGNNVAAVPARRGPGRPPKQKRGPGRPRKNESLSALPPKRSPLKHGLGHPRKNASDNVQLEQHARRAEVPPPKKRKKAEHSSQAPSRAWNRTVAELETSLADTEMFLGPRTAKSAFRRL